MRAARALCVALFAAAGCAHSSAQPAAKTTAADAKPARVEFIEDDYAAALARARAEHKPLVVDAWAPWCHTCLYMKSYVFTDPAIVAMASRFVWASVDTEKAKNAAAIAKYPMEAWPTMWVVDPSNESIALKWVGSANVHELTALLDDADASIKHRGGEGEASTALLRGNRAAVEGRADEAIASYREAIAKAPAGWARRAIAVASLSEALRKSDPSACVDLAAKEAPSMPPGTALVNTLVNGVEAAAELPKNAPSRAALPTLLEHAKRVAADTSLALLADDRSGLYETIVETMTAEGDTSGAKAIARAWAAFLETEAMRAPTPEARVVFDAHRLNAYLATGDEPKAIDMLVQSERDFPNDYNPPARLARVYSKLRQYDLALQAIGRALSRVYGPRALRHLEAKADILDAKGDRDGAIATLREAVDLADKLPLTGSYPKLRARLAERLEKATKK